MRPVATPIQIAVRWYGLSSVRLFRMPTNLKVIAAFHCAGCWPSVIAVWSSSSTGYAAMKRRAKPTASSAPTKMPAAW